MKVQANIIMGVCLLALTCTTGCDYYERKGVVTPEITVNTQSLNLFVGDFAQLKASPTEYTFKFTSDDPEVALVDGSGLVLATGDGSTFIVVSSGDAICRVPVTCITKIPMSDFRITDPTTGTVLGENPIELNIGAMRTVVLNVVPSNANDASAPVWRSLNTNVANVSYKGEIVGISTGTTTVQCRVNDIVKSLTVMVK